MLSERDAWLLLANCITNNDIAMPGRMARNGLCAAIAILVARQLITRGTARRMDCAIDAERERLKSLDTFLWPFDAKGYNARRQFCLEHSKKKRAKHATRRRKRRSLSTSRR